MQNKENVCEDTTLTGASAEAQEGKEASTVLGKFKDVDALAKAYGSLEAEFTRRSQRLKELEKQVENFERAQSAGMGAEKLRKTAESRREEEKKFDEFVKTVENPAPKERTKPTFESAPKEEQPTTEKEEKAEEAAFEGEAQPVAVKYETLSSSDEVYEKAVGDEKVRLRIIGEYLASLNKSSAPITASGRGVLATQPMRVKSIGQAGDLALQYFKKGLES